MILIRFHRFVRREVSRLGWQVGTYRYVYKLYQLFDRNAAQKARTQILVFGTKVSGRAGEQLMKGFSGIRYNAIYMCI